MKDIKTSELSDSGLFGTYRIVGNKIILRLRDKVCETPEELIGSGLFRDLLRRYMEDLKNKGSGLLGIFGKTADKIGGDDAERLIRVLAILVNMPLKSVPKLLEDGQHIVADPSLLQAFVEGLYNYWRKYERFIICDSSRYPLYKRPYRTFDTTIEALMHLVRRTYRDIEENIRGRHPNIFRQVHAGAELGVIALPKDLHLPGGKYASLQAVPVIRQILLYPPLLLDPPMNKRSGKFERIGRNPLEAAEVNAEEWLCYPAKVGDLLILVYVHEKFFGLGFSLCNLFEPAEDDFLEQHVPDAVYVYGAPRGSLDGLAEMPTVFYEDTEHDMLVGACPRDDRFGYFGYLKKMILTLHNIKAMKKGRMPFHGAMVRILPRKGAPRNIVIVGESGTGKSETLEALRIMGEDEIREMHVIADDMGSLEIREDGRVLGYGTEVGAFVRLDDLQPGYAFGQLDRCIIMSPGKVNSRILLPVTTWEELIRGYPVDMLLYANNYEGTDEDHPLIEQLESPEDALRVFREGTAMSKGTTTSTGLVHSYFANIFGPVQYKELHDPLARRYFESLFAGGIFVGQLRTRLGIAGYERKGPQKAAAALLEML